MTNQSVVKPLRCKIGFHQWFIDAAMYSRAECCNLCGTYKDPAAQALLEQERAMWASQRRQS